MCCGYDDYDGVYVGHVESLARWPDGAKAQGLCSRFTALAGQHCRSSAEKIGRVSKAIPTMALPMLLQGGAQTYSCNPYLAWCKNCSSSCILAWDSCFSMASFFCHRQVSRPLTSDRLSWVSSCCRSSSICLASGFFSRLLAAAALSAICRCYTVSASTTLCCHCPLASLSACLSAASLRPSALQEVSCAHLSSSHSQLLYMYAECCVSKCTISG